eukprot:GEMP01042968.1.p1 GENE.GEMP01042968.1~~GEMP01042968.1.p1  ORF type:complete len:374 (+),score=90.50 GEMP01042968.1:423-1544(+)
MWFREMYQLNEAPESILQLLEALWFPDSGNELSWATYWRLRVDVARLLKPVKDAKTGAVQLVWTGAEKLWGAGAPVAVEFDEMHNNYFSLWLFSFSSRFQLRPGIDMYEAHVGKAIDDTIFRSLLPMAGNTVGLPYNVFPHPCSILTCTHTFQLTLLLATLLAAKVNVFHTDYYEIGGGYGGMMYMFGHWAIVQYQFVEEDARNFSSWTWHSFDLRFVQHWQQWYLTNSKIGFSSTVLDAASQTAEERRAQCTFTPELRFCLVDAAEVHTWYLEHRLAPPSRVTFVDQRHRPAIVIATHSWSELSFEDFAMYVDVLVLGIQAEWILYSANIFNPTPMDAARKIATLERFYRVERQVWTEGGTAVNTMYRRRNE